MATIAEALAYLASAWTHWKPTESTLWVYEDALQDESPEEVVEAVRHLVRTDSTGYAPTVGKIREAIRDMRDLRARQAKPDPTTKLLEERRSADPGDGGSMLDAVEQWGSEHLKWSMRNPDAYRTGIPGVSFAFPSRGAHCGCSECRQEFVA